MPPPHFAIAQCGLQRFFFFSFAIRGGLSEPSGGLQMTDARTTTRLTGWARIADYLFGRNALIGLASLMLLLISGYATWHGMRDFIVGVSTSSATAGREGPGGLSVPNDVLVIVVVIALTFLMWLALRETFG